MRAPGCPSPARGPRQQVGHVTERAEAGARSESPPMHRCVAFLEGWWWGRGGVVERHCFFIYSFIEGEGKGKNEGIDFWGGGGDGGRNGAVEAYLFICWFVCLLMNLYLFMNWLRWDEEVNKDFLKEEGRMFIFSDEGGTEREVFFLLRGLGRRRGRGKREREKWGGSLHTSTPAICFGLRPPSHRPPAPSIYVKRSDLLEHTLSLRYFSPCPVAFFGRRVECWSYEFFPF